MKPRLSRIDFATASSVNCGVVGTAAIAAAAAACCAGAAGAVDCTEGSGAASAGLGAATGATVGAANAGLDATAGATVGAALGTAVGTVAGLVGTAEGALATVAVVLAGWCTAATVGAFVGLTDFLLLVPPAALAMTPMMNRAATPVTVHLTAMCACERHTSSGPKNQKQVTHKTPWIQTGASRTFDQISSAHGVRARGGAWGGGGDSTAMVIPFASALNLEHAESLLSLRFSLNARDGRNGRYHSSP